VIFREATQEDVDYLQEHSVNPKIEFDGDRLDYVFTLEHEGNPIGVGGFRMIVATCAWCWVDLTEDARKYPLSVYSTIKSWIDKFVGIHKLSRIQAFVRDIDHHVRLVEHLGFERESTMKNFYGNEDAFMYARIIDG
jgi:hypothetical protein